MAGRHNHQQTSIILGYDRIEYQSSAVAMNESIGKGGSNQSSHRTSDNLNKECHVQFGEPGKKRDFTISSKLADPTGQLHLYRGKLSTANADLLKHTTAAFGNDVAPYVTSTGLATQWNREAVQETIALRNDIRKRTGPRPTRGISFDDEVEYVSESKSAYENKIKNYKPSIMAESVKNDLRATHFSLGHEKLDYRLSSHIDRLSPEEFTNYATRQPPLHDLKKSTVEIT